MTINDDVLRYDEQAIMRLRTLYRQFGYTQYRMSRFEEYGMYAENKSFLASGDIITFTGAGGRLMAMRPDVTLSIVKNTKDGGGLKKLYYNENVYRPDGAGREFRERMQAGLECIGDIGVESMAEILMLAQRSLRALGERSCLDISHMGFLGGILDGAELSPAQREELLHRLGEKNIPELTALCAGYGLDRDFTQRLTALCALYGPYGEVIDELRRLSSGEAADAALRELEEIFAVLHRLGADGDINLDFSLIHDMSYYSGIIFGGYIDGVPAKVLSGGRYDKLMRKFGKSSGAIGFAVYLDLLERLSPGPAAEKCGAQDARKIINVALPKGRLGEKALAIFEAAGWDCPAIHEESRKLVFENPNAGVRYFWVKPSDVAIYVERGAADIGIAGKDILLEYSPDVYELLDLGIGRCRMAVAAEKGFTDSHDSTLRVATKFRNIARKYYDGQSREIDIIALNGSIELAPILGLSDVIVDIVETGKTLLENNLEPVETIVDVSARLISNKASYRFNYEEISGLCGRIAESL